LDFVRVSATGAGVNYYPEFLARELGFFADEGLRVEVEVLGNGPGVPRNVGTGAADVGLGGIWLPMLYRGRLDTFIPFAQLCNRLAAFLLARKSVTDFKWDNLSGKIVVAPGGAPNFWMVVASTLRQAGVDPYGVRFVSDFLAEEATALFRGGFGDFFIAMPPASDVLVRDGVGSVVADFAGLGEIPWSIFYAKPEFLERDDKVAGRFTKAIQRALGWILSNDPMGAPGVLAKRYPSVSPQVIAESVRSCRARGIWVSSARIPEEPLLRWQKVIVDEGRLIDAPMPYSEIVDSRPADWAERELAGRA
jgi:NitT/TauT family transport system substrate-binding protein